jgi:hypothetical protein
MRDCAKGLQPIRFTHVTFKGILGALCVREPEKPKTRKRDGPKRNTVRVSSTYVGPTDSNVRIAGE